MFFFGNIESRSTTFVRLKRRDAHSCCTSMFFRRCIFPHSSRWEGWQWCDPLVAARDLLIGETICVAHRAPPTPSPYVNSRPSTFLMPRKSEEQTQVAVKMSSLAKMKRAPQENVFREISVMVSWSVSDEQGFQNHPCQRRRNCHPSHWFKCKVALSCAKTSVKTYGHGDIGTVACWWVPPSLVVSRVLMDASRSRAKRCPFTATTA